jgi:hypothetical protein
MRSFRALYLYAALLALTLAAYLPVWNNDFVDFDDDLYIVTNPQVTNGFSGSSFRWIWTIDRAPYWTPLTWLSLQLDAHCFAVRTAEATVIPAAAVHGQNLFWHAASVLLLFGFWQRVSGRCWPSFLIAALFAVHPMHVESVAWAAERKDVLSVFFGLLTLFAYVRYVDKPNWPRYLALPAVYSLSLMCKPMLLTMPVVLLLLDYWPLGRARGHTALPEARKATPWSRLILEKGPLFLLAVVIGVVTLGARDAHGSLIGLDILSFSARLNNALTGYGWYVGSTLCPLWLGILYPHPQENGSLLMASVGAALLLALSLFCWRQARRRPWLIVGWLWFVGTLSPVIGFAQGGKQAWADRFSYWPHIGLFVALVWGLGEVVERWRLPVLAPRLAGAFVLGWLTLLTWRQVGCWRDTPTLWQQALRVTRDNDQAHERLARYYYTQGCDQLSAFHLTEAARIQRQRLFAPSGGTVPAPVPQRQDANCRDKKLSVRQSPCCLSDLGTMNDVAAGDFRKLALHLLPEHFVLMVSDGVQFGDNRMSRDRGDRIRLDGQSECFQFGDGQPDDEVARTLHLGDCGQGILRLVQTSRAKNGKTLLAGIKGPKGFGLDRQDEVGFVINRMNEP